jgi:tetratricopeptide (TPR) repeat protein
VTRVAAAGASLAAVLTLGLAAGPQGEPGGPTPTFARDVAPILWSRCVSCHQPDGPAPFSLLSYADARPRASLIATATRSRFMPPWKTSADVGPFLGQPRLSDQEVDLLSRWASGGAPEGEPRELPSPPRLAKGWQLGTPDLVVQPEGAFTMPADGADVFRIFVVPLPTAVARFVRGVEFRPGNERVVHHANLRIDRTTASRAFDAADPAPGYEGLIAHSAAFPDGHFLGWTPGQLVPLVPQGLAWRLEPGTDLVVEVHMQPSGKPESVRPVIGLHFGADPPGRPPIMLRLGRQGLDIAPGDARYVSEDDFVLPVDVEVLALQPHAHSRATEVRAVATPAGGPYRSLLDIPAWDFRWQHVYRYEVPLVLRRGTLISARYTFDNSAANPRNPDSPPRRVFWGQRSSDEMADVWVQLRPVTEGDRERLVSAIRPKVLAEDAIGYERLIASGPETLSAHDDVAQIYLELGRPADAVRHFAASARLAPASAAAHFNLGTALAIAGRGDEAVTVLREALRLRPDYGPAHNNLGGLLLRGGDTDAALDHVRTAVRLEPGNVEARASLAEVYAALGRLEEAAGTVEAALRLKPAEPVARVLRARLADYERRRGRP